MDQSVQEALSAFTGWEQVQAQDGAGGNPDFPEEGEHEVLIVGYETSQGSFRYNAIDGSKVELPCPSIRFLYERELDEDHPDFDAENPANNTKTFSGVPFQLLSSKQIQGLPETEGCKQQTRVNIMYGRLKQHLNVILGGTSDSLESDLTEVTEKLDGDATIPVLMFAEHRRQNPADPESRVYKTDYLRELLTA